VSYPLWNLFLTMLELFIWIVLIVLVVWTILNIRRSHSLRAWAKVGWLALVIVVPFVGVFAYLIARGGENEGTGADRGYARPGVVRGADSIDEFARRVGVSYYARAVNAVRRLRQEYDRMLEQVDLLLMPTTPHKA
jgi:Asp-tRNA(Asn)/Glu-tRNA(Gln) amidotransferase A subunit family amidase